MKKAQEIYEKMLRGGVSMWEADVAMRSLVVGSEIAQILFQGKTEISFDELLQQIPATARAEMMQHLSDDVKWTMPIKTSNGLQWLEIHKLLSETNTEGHKTYIGTVRAMDYSEVGRQIFSSGINVRTCEPMMVSFGLLNNRETFHEGLCLLMSALCKQLGGSRCDTVKWLGGNKFEVLNYSGNAATDKYGSLSIEGHVLQTKMCEQICKTRKLLTIDANNPINDKWTDEKEFFSRQQARSVIVAPIIVDDEVWGIVVLVSMVRSVWSVFDLQWISMVTNRISVTLSNNEMRDRINDQIHVMSQACEAGKLLTWVWNCETGKGEVNIYGSAEERSSECTLEGVISRMYKTDQARCLKTIRALKNGDIDNVLLRVRMRGVVDDTWGWRELRGVPTKNIDGKIERIVGISRDITEEVRRANEEKLNIQFQNSIYNKMPAGIEFFNEEGRLIYMNDTALEIFGVIGGRRSMMGLGLFENPNLTEEQRTAIKYTDTVQYIISYDFRKVVYKSSRTDVIEMNYRMSKLYKKNNLVGYIVAVADNSELVQKSKQISIFQRYFLEIGKFAKMGICWFSDTKNGYVSEQWNINLGIRPEAPYMRNLSLCVHVLDEDLEVYGSLLGRIFVGDIDSFQYELRVTHDDGLLHYIKVQFVRSEEAVIGVSIDVTQTKENEKLLIEAKLKAETADMLKLQFLDNMNHEIRTPLNAIVGFSDIIAQTAGSDDLKMYADLIRSNNDILLDTIGDIIDLSKITSGTMEYAYTEGDIDEVVREVYDKYNAQSHVNIEFLCTGGEHGVKAYCDVSQIKRILCHFVSNAFKFTAAGRVELYYKVVNNELVFSVTDTGCGIPVNKIDKIFDPYFKVDLFSVGTGLGLPICNSLARDMGGRIEVKSTEGVGSHFKFYVPYISPSHIPRQAMPINDIMLLSSNGEIIQFVSYALSNYNLFIEQEHVFMSLWLEKRPMLTIIDQQLFGDSISVVVSSLHNYVGEHKVIVLCTEGVPVDKANIIDAGAEQIIMLPTSSENFKMAIMPYIKRKNQRR